MSNEFLESIRDRRSMMKVQLELESAKRGLLFWRETEISRRKNENNLPLETMYRLIAKAKMKAKEAASDIKYWELQIDNLQRFKNLL